MRFSLFSLKFQFIPAWLHGSCISAHCHRQVGRSTGRWAGRLADTQANGLYTGQRADIQLHRRPLWPTIQWHFIENLNENLKSDLMAHSVFTSICCRNEDDEVYVTVDHFEPSTNERPEPTADVEQGSQALSESDLLKLVKLNLEDGAIDGRRPTVVQMVDGSFQLQRGMIEFNLKVKPR